MGGLDDSRACMSAANTWIGEVSVWRVDGGEGRGGEGKCAMGVWEVLVEGGQMLVQGGRCEGGGGGRSIPGRGKGFRVQKPGLAHGNLIFALPPLPLPLPSSGPHRRGQ